MKHLTLLPLLLLFTLACTDYYMEDEWNGDSLGSMPSWKAELTSLEHRIASADVVVKARLRSAAASTVQSAGTTELHLGSLEYTFEVGEYIKGTGDSTIVAIVVEDSHGEEVKADAVPIGAQLLASRYTDWDNRDALLFLEADPEFLLDLPEAHYYLGFVNSYYGNEGDAYTIVSPNDKRWLPAQRSSSGPRGASGSQRFLLDLPSGGSGASGASGNSGTITLNQFKSRMQAIEREIAAADDPDAYRECIIERHRLRARVDRVVAEKGSYTTWTFEETMASGQPAGTLVRTSWHGGDSDSTYKLLDNNQGLFTGDGTTGEVFNTRPLPGGEYRLTEDWLPHVLVPCDGQPPEMNANEFVVITVTAPPGTVHEALFDPVSSGDSVGYFGTGDAVTPTTFTTGGFGTTIQSLRWQDSTLTLGLSLYVDLGGKFLEFITGDGTTSLSLEASAATGDSTAGTLTWAVGSQPWSSGDELMLRIRDSNTPPTFAQDAYTFSVAESTSAFTVIGTVKAVDQDGDTVLHKITGGNEGGRFSIDGWEGFILVRDRLDYETKSSYELTVTGTDPAGRSATTTVTINVTDVAE